jgi:hypothetical protein
MESDAMPSAKIDYAPIRNDKCVNIRLCLDNCALDSLNFTLEHYGVQGKICLYATRMAPIRDFGKVRRLEVDTAPCAHVEGAKAEVDGVGTGIKRSLQAGEITCRS